MTYIRNWFNPQLKYQNLKRKAEKNTMTDDDIEFMWVPWTLLNNIEPDNLLSCCHTKSNRHPKVKRPSLDLSKDDLKMGFLIL